LKYPVLNGVQEADGNMWLTFFDKLEIVIRRLRKQLVQYLRDRFRRMRIIS